MFPAGAWFDGRFRWSIVVVWLVGATGRGRLLQAAVALSRPVPA